MGWGVEVARAGARDGSGQRAGGGSAHSAGVGRVGGAAEGEEELVHVGVLHVHVQHVGRHLVAHFLHAPPVRRRARCGGASSRWHALAARGTFLLGERALGTNLVAARTLQRCSCHHKVDWHESRLRLGFTQAPVPRPVSCVLWLSCSRARSPTCRPRTQRQDHR